MWAPSFLVFVHLIYSLLLSCSARPLETDTIEKRSGVPKLAGSAVAFGAGTYPRANRLSDGSLIGAYTAFSGGNNIIKTVRSTDGGATWQALGTVTQGASNANDIDNPYILQLPSGKVLCAFRNHSKDPNTGAYTYFRITICISSDQGKTWSYLSTPASDSGPVNGNWEPFLRNAQAGLQIYYSRENSAQDQDTLERFSTDGGATWSAPQTISGAGITSRDGMTGVTTISGTKLLAVFETETTGVFSIASITSTDDGKTWGNRRTIYNPSSPNTSAGAPQIATVGTSLAVSFQTNEDQVLTAPASDYVGKVAAKLITSTDGGATWGNKITVGQVQSVWPSLYTLNSASFLMLFDNGGAKAQKISLS
ncbi:hypothetical protein ACLMJK_009663 [Lecanora helva]